MAGAIIYWKQGGRTQNMGDYLTELFIAKILAPGPVHYPRIRLIGSVISEEIIRADLHALRGMTNARIGFWGCGQRDEKTIDRRLRASCQFHGVRGPLTRVRLGLPDTTPIGDPGLLLPILHMPKKLPELAGRTLCMPHFDDPASDRDIIEKSGADLLLRPNLPASLDVLLKAIDVICSVDFVIAGALHAAIIACAYGKPFAYYVDNFVDIPFKWLDFSASVNIPAVFVRNIAEGQSAWQSLLAPAIQIPSLTPLLQAFPGAIRPGLLAAAQTADSRN